MRLLDRYLLRGLLFWLGLFLVALLVLITTFTLFGELDALQERKLHLLDIIEYCGSMQPGFVVLVLPITLLLALLYTLTTHARHNEITAMSAAGISLWRICAPHFAVGVAASLLLFGVNEWLVPRSIDYGNRIKSRYVHKADDPMEKNVYRGFGFSNVRGHRSWLIGEYHLDTAEMFKPEVNWLRPDGTILRLYADRAIRTNDGWTFFNVQEFTQSNADAQVLPALETNVLAMPQFDETPAQIRSEIKISEDQGLRTSRRADIPLADILAYLRLHPHLPAADSGWLLTKPHGRLAAPWTCLVVVLIAIPFGVPSGRRNLFVGVAGSIFICLAYFFVQNVSLALGSGGHLPGWVAAWLPNIVFAATGLILTLRVR
ncbi:MAG: LptF/LptG family permease [Solirubrobacteraceae bacterium]